MTHAASNSLQSTSIAKNMYNIKVLLDFFLHNRAPPTRWSTTMLVAAPNDRPTLTRRRTWSCSSRLAQGSKSKPTSRLGHLRLWSFWTFWDNNLAKHELKTNTPLPKLFYEPKMRWFYCRPLDHATRWGLSLPMGILICINNHNCFIQLSNCSIFKLIDPVNKKSKN